MTSPALTEELAAASPQLLVLCRSQRWWGQVRQARWVEGTAWIRFFVATDDLLAACRRCTRALILFELPPSQPDGGLEAVGKLTSARRLHRVVCLAEPSQIAYEFAMREAGACDFATSVAEFPRIQALFQRYVVSHPPLRLPWAQAIIHQLPWRSLLP